MYLSESIVWPSDATALRQMCLQVLAHQAPQLGAYQNELNQTEYEWIRRPEVGMVMVHGRTEASGTPFAVGETTVSRCVLRLASGETGFGYVLGRDKLQAELIALADAHLQTEQQDYWMAHMMEPLAQQWKQAQAEHSANVADSRVEFFTMVRGED